MLCFGSQPCANLSTPSANIYAIIAQSGAVQLDASRFQFSVSTVYCGSALPIGAARRWLAVGDRGYPIAEPLQRFS